MMNEMNGDDDDDEMVAHGHPEVSVPCIWASLKGETLVAHRECGILQVSFPCNLGLLHGRAPMMKMY